ncbi:MAG: hypothetical protein Q8P62_03595 [Candidatus Peregrinibacteria bacterium]|nr:hypothetical protein [Candidatus Peregrinibacteria bacterium]
MTPERYESGKSDQTEATTAQTATTTPNATTAQPNEAPESLGIHERLTKANAELSTQIRSGKPTKIFQIVNWMIRHNTSTIPRNKLAEIMGEGKIDPITRLRIQGLQNKTFQKQNISFRSHRNGSIRVISGNPHYKKWQDEQPKPSALPKSPYTPPTVDSSAPSTKSHHARLNIETTAQLHKVPLATRTEINAALQEALDNPRIRNNTSGRTQRDDGTPVSTPIYLLEKFLEANPTTQEKLEKGFSSKQRLLIARDNANNSARSKIRNNALRIFTDHHRRHPEKSEWKIESTNIDYTDSLQDKEATKIYTDAKAIKENASLFTNAPQSARFIFGALTGLTMGATFEEFSVVTGLPEEDILKAVDHINTSVIPQEIDLKIHNRNGILIFGTRHAVTSIDTPKTRSETIKWKAIILEVREKIANTEAITIEPAPAQAKSAPQAATTKLATLLKNPNSRGTAKVFLETLLRNGGKLLRAEAERIREEGATVSTFSVFINNIRSTLRRNGLTLLLEPNAVKITTFKTPGQTTTETAQLETAQLETEQQTATEKLTKIIKNTRTSKLSKEILQQFITNPTEVPAATVTQILRASGMKSRLSTAILNLNRPLSNHGLILVLDKKAGIIKLETFETPGQTTPEPAQLSPEQPTPGQSESPATPTEAAEATASTSEQRALAAEAPAQSLLSKVQTLTDTIEAKDLELKRLNKELSNAEDLRKQARIFATRDARRDTRIEVTAEFAKQIEKLTRKISDLEKEIRGLNAAQLRTLRLLQQQNLTTPEAVANISALTQEATRLRKQNIALTAKAREAEATATPTPAQPSGVSAKLLADTKRDLDAANQNLETAQETIANQDARITQLENNIASLQIALTHRPAQTSPELPEDTKQTIEKLRREIIRLRQEQAASDLMSERVRSLEEENATLREKSQGKGGKTSPKPKGTKKGHAYHLPASIPTAPTEQGYRFEPQPTRTRPKMPAAQTDTQNMTVINIGNFTFDNIFTLKQSVISAVRKLGENLTLEDIQTLKASLESVHEDPSTKPYHKPTIMRYLEVLQRKLDLNPPTSNGRNGLPQDEYAKLITAATNTLR